MKTFSLSIIAFLAFSITCKAQWTLSGSNIYPTTITNNVGIGTTNAAYPLQVGSIWNNLGSSFALAVGGNLAIGNITSGSQPELRIIEGTGGYPITIKKFSGYTVITDSQGIINLNSSIGIGTNSPLTPLDVKLAANQHIQFATNVNGGYSGASGIVCINDANTGYTPLGFYASNYYFGGGNVGIATTDTKGYTFAVNGTAIATSITVKAYANWPDFVFKPTYKLASLTEVKTYIDQNHHLPDVPSAAEVEQNGLNLGEMNKVLLKKVEDLTLYLIEQDKKLADQQKTNQVVEEQSKLLKSQQKQIDELKRNLNNLDHKKIKQQ
ncbi:hypothetical protein [Mucilaginibacter sp. OK098]|uniref:hypothetical protein n=1 Tax=Mucilaginibacter sp. OK098 TaxID=1855297 RepID=UPI0009130C64|nr:hypothetical protein [Mucilaginibacter sp. OK098]SHN37607.1 hypothetical protein SAMN05216524_11622 [Mucilaginibacter sp. OK098]